VRRIYENLIAFPDRPFDIISKKWLTDWLSGRSSDEIKAVDNNELLCIHSKLNFKAVSSFKCISTIGADQIYEIYGGGPRLNEDSLCRTCISKQVDVMKMTAKVEEDYKLITSQLKFTLSPDEDCFWVGKDSLRSWKQIKIKTFENSCFEENGLSNDYKKFLILKMIIIMLNDFQVILIMNRMMAMKMISSIVKFYAITVCHLPSIKVNLKVSKVLELEK